MKQNRKQISEQVGINAHTAEADKLFGEGILPTSLGKFHDVESLCKAYNSLESEFTKRCQRIKELEGEIEELKVKSESFKKEENADASADEKVNHKFAENADNGLIDGDFNVKGEFLEETKQEKAPADNPTGFTEDETQVGEKPDGEKPDGEKPDVSDLSTSESVDETNLRKISEGAKVRTIMEFFRDYPEASVYALKIGVNLNEDEITKTALLDAYVKVLRQEKAVLPKNGESPFEKSRNACDVSESVKEEIIKDYLFSLKENGPKLMGGGGEIPVTPPVRPKTLAEAGRLAQNIIKLR